MPPMTEENVDVFVCINVTCRSRGAESVMARLKQTLAERGLQHVKLEPIICFAACNLGPNVVIPSRRCWLTEVSAGDAGEVADYLESGVGISRLQQKNDPAIETMIFDMIDAGLLEKAPRS
jgi:(2Fe-2S) ferredoxin